MTERLLPLAGINNVQDDDELKRGGDSPVLFVRDALNVDISSSGKVNLRPAGELVTSLNYENLWQSPLHHDVFATLDGELVKVNTQTWTFEKLTFVGQNVRFEVINNLVYINGSRGLFSYNGFAVSPLTIDTPASPLLQQDGNGTLKTGQYGVAISWLRNGVESAVSAMSHVELAGQSNYDQINDLSINVTLPFCIDDTVTDVAIYVTQRNGAELYKFGTYPVSTNQVSIHEISRLGKIAEFQHLSPMPSGKFMKYWNGRLITAERNVIKFSEPMAYHLYDERHGYMMMPQRITFIQPVDGGIWVGQTDHVAFLTGAQPKDMSYTRKSTQAPIYDSCILVDADLVGDDVSQNSNVALWLAENGYVLGTATGQIIQYQAGKLQGITAKLSRSVRLGRRIITTVT
ncbi:hypothetical protein [Acinetobacter sp. SWAC57]|uniref:hypothetical protein n=1 Tax=Acinetobacter sp. SWAC57 TaxID=2293834 RepID=UPI000E5AB447|nr:hypothetical protein [Acinetobacter sp. SWAC57]RGD90571.1 hypothetical protein DYI96_10400 [Acinetobacter sp. SWAC57]